MPNHSQLAEAARLYRTAQDLYDAARAALYDAVRTEATRHKGTPAGGPSAIARGTGHVFTREYVAKILAGDVGTPDVTPEGARLLDWLKQQTTPTVTEEKP